MAETVRIGDHQVGPGERANLELPAARLPTGTWLSLPVVVVNGRRPGPRLWLDSALHGDELNGFEIIRRVLRRLDVRRLSGSVVAVPIVNVFGFVHQDRYLPDRRDLNRSFPGSPRGSLAARLAHLFVKEVVERCDYGVDFHTGAGHRTNLPQLRADLSRPEIGRLANAFAPPAIYHAPLRPGSLRATADRLGVPLLVFEGGEPLRFDRYVIEHGEAGTLRLMAELEMISPPGDLLPPPETVHRIGESSWQRARRSGVFRLDVELGELVEEGQLLGSITDPLSRRDSQVRARFGGLVLGHTNNPLIYQGDALVHLGRLQEGEGGSRS